MHTHTHTLSLSLSLSLPRGHIFGERSLLAFQRVHFLRKVVKLPKLLSTRSKAQSTKAGQFLIARARFISDYFRKKKQNKTEKEKKNRELVTEWKRREKIGLQNRFGDRRETTVTETGGRTRFPDRSTRKSTRYEQSEVKISYKQLARPGVKSGANNYF